MSVFEKNNILLRNANKLAGEEMKVINARLCTFVNPYSYWMLRSCPDILNEFDTIAVDGISLCIFLRIFGIKRVNRLSFDMTSVARNIFQESQASGRRLFIVGSSPSEIGNAVDGIKKRYPRLQICGFHHGYFDKSDELAINAQIRDADADVVICGMGAVKQEGFLSNLALSGWNGKGYTCGGFLHQISQKGLDYYPGWVDRLHIRWMFRIANEPRLIRRYFVQYPIAFGALLRDALFFRLSGSVGGG